MCFDDAAKFEIEHVESRRIALRLTAALEYHIFPALTFYRIRAYYRIIVFSYFHITTMLQTAHISPIETKYALDVTDARY